MGNSVSFKLFQIQHGGISSALQRNFSNLPDAEKYLMKIEESYSDSGYPCGCPPYILVWDVEGEEISCTSRYVFDKKTSSIKLLNDVDWI